MLIDKRYINAIQEEVTRIFGFDPTKGVLTPEEFRLLRSASFMYLMGPLIHPCNNNDL